MFNLDKFHKKEMPGGGGNGDGGAEERRRQEEERQRNVDNITMRVNSIFDKYAKAGWIDDEYRGQGGEFVPGRARPQVFRDRSGGGFGMVKRAMANMPGWKEPRVTETILPENGITYFDMIRDNYVDNYTPELEDQYADAREQLALRLASRGLSDGSVANRKYGDQREQYDKSRIKIGDQALAAARNAEADIEQTRGDLISLAEGGAGMANVAAQAAAKAKALTAPRNYDPLGDVFMGMTALGANDAAAKRAGYRGLSKSPSIFNSNPTGGGSARSVS